MNRIQLAALKPYLLSHHPLCDQYSNHTVTLHGWKFCIGCFIGFPAGILTILVISWVGRLIQYNSLTLLIWGIVFLIPYGLNMFISAGKILKVAAKIALGISSAFLIVSIIIAPLPMGSKFLLYVIFANVLFGIMGVKRFFEMRKICKKCEFEADFKHCPGLGPLIRSFSKEEAENQVVIQNKWIKNKGDAKKLKGSPA